MAVELVVIGTSLGGLSALQVLLGALGPDLRLPVAVVQHRSTESDEELVNLLRRYCPLPVAEAEDKEPIVSGRIYLAPPDYHLLVDGASFALSIDDRVCHARPSIDVLFESAAISYQERLLGVVLTGASRDGAEGARQLKQRGGTLLVQDPGTAENRIMPEAALSRASADQVLALRDIAAFLNATARGSQSG